MQEMPEFDAVVEVHPDGMPCFDTKYSDAFWYVDDGRQLASHDWSTRNLLLPLPFSSRGEIPDELVAALRLKAAGALVLAHQAGPGGTRWGLFTGYWPDDWR